MFKLNSDGKFKNDFYYCYGRGKNVPLHKNNISPEQSEHISWD